MGGASHLANQPKTKAWSPLLMVTSYFEGLKRNRSQIIKLAGCVRTAVFSFEGLKLCLRQPVTCRGSIPIKAGSSVPEILPNRVLLFPKFALHGCSFYRRA